MADTSIVMSMVTTLDNPYNPFTEFDKWYNFDELAGYHTSSYLARIAYDSDELSPKDQALAIELAVDEIVKLNLTGNYIKVTDEGL